MNGHPRIGGVVFLAAMVLFAPQAPRAAESDALIKGTTDFLLDRAYDNYVYILQTRLLANPFLRQYLPNTVRVAQAGDLRSLLINKDLWRKAVEQDLEALAHSDKVEIQIRPVIDELCRVAGPSGDALARLCGLAKGENVPGKLLSEDARKLATDSRTERRSRNPAAIREQPLQKLEPLYLGLKSDQAQIAIQAIPELVDGLLRVKSACQKAEKDGRVNYTICVVELAAVLRAAAHAEYVVHCKAMDLGLICVDLSDRKLGMNEEDRNFSDFLNYALFFAQMADAKDGDTVKALLKSVTVPPVSFGLKRERFRTGLFLSAYLGAGFVSSAADGTTKREYIVVAPIGLEVTQGLSGGDSVSVLLSPIDLGYPVSLKLAEVDTTVRTSDIIAPGAYVFYGVRKYPIALGMGYTRVRSIENPDRRVGRVSLVLAFDLPLFSLY